MKISMKNSFGVALLLVLGACARPYQLDADQSQMVYGSDGYTIPGQSDIYGNQTSNQYAAYGDFYEDPNYGVNVIGGPQAQAKDRIIYFAYDSARLDNRSLPVVREHANYLRQNPQTRVVLEGHTDERGTREYNIGLGERRAYAVRNYFIEEGVNPAQIRVLSYGEERPAALCHNESCYSKNRRAVIVY